MIAMLLNYNNEDKEVRKDSQQCMKLLAVMIRQFTSEKKPLFKQFDCLFSNIAMFYNKAKVEKTGFIE
jgi:hypothetical protein